MTDSIKAYIESLETDTAHTESEWREIIEAEQADYERQDERFIRLTEAEISEILAQLDKDNYMVKYIVYGAYQNAGKPGAMNYMEEILNKCSTLSEAQECSKIHQGAWDKIIIRDGNDNTIKEY